MKQTLDSPQVYDDSDMEVVITAGRMLRWIATPEPPPGSEPLLTAALSFHWEAVCPSWHVITVHAVAAWQFDEELAKGVDDPLALSRCPDACFERARHKTRLYMRQCASDDPR